MLRLFRRIAHQLVISLFDIFVHLLEWPRILLLRAIDYSALVKSLERGGVTRLALIAPDPKQILEFSVRHLVRGLLDNRYTIVVLMPEERAADWLKREFPQIHIAARSEKGRDFGAWKAILVKLFDSGLLRRSIEKLILVNDSLYWNAASGEIVRGLTETELAWSCLFENFERHYHAQSFLLAFDGRVLNSQAFVGFWAKYKPYSSRRHSINSGEVKLSKVIGKAFGKPECLLSSGLVTRQLRLKGKENPEDIVISLEINRHVSRDYGSRLSQFKINLGLSPNPMGGFSSVTELSRVIEFHMISNAVATMMESHNPTHMVGLLINVLFGYPIKRDVCQRGSFQIGDVLRVAIGYSEEERGAIARDLRARELLVSMRGVKRVLFDAGRI
jgi:hypothetical protein